MVLLLAVQPPSSLSLSALMLLLHVETPLLLNSFAIVLQVNITVLMPIGSAKNFTVFLFTKYQHSRRMPYSLYEYPMRRE